jgi:hypothetical protein
MVDALCKFFQTDSGRLVPTQEQKASQKFIFVIYNMGTYIFLEKQLEKKPAGSTAEPF